MAKKANEAQQGDGVQMSADQANQSEQEQSGEGGEGNEPQSGANDAPLRTDGPTLEEFLKAGYKAENYPPRGYTDRRGEKPAPTHVRMRRVEPMHKGGPTSADVHVSEVDNWIAAGWRRAE